MSCSHVTGCELFVQFAMNPALEVWKEHYCEGEHGRCARYQLSNSGQPVPLTLLPNGKQITVVRSETELGATALFNSIIKQRVRMVRSLIRAGVNVNTRNIDGTTPLMAAAEAGNVEIVSMLLESGADPTLTNMHGESAMDVALQHDNEEIAALLAGGSTAGKVA
ncbi:MAG TPA: ankyrin repeat domain-containing protein [Thiotrichales bacterium]|nr:ankyrin repeat domain-containing protein [Thiotrichales bacterium]